MKGLLLFTCFVALTSAAWAADHGPVFGYATPVNSQYEWSFDTGIFGRAGSHGTQFSTGSQLGYGLTPHLTLNAFLPGTFGSASFPETRIYPSGEWTAGASWRFLHSVTSVGRRTEATGSLAMVLPGPQKEAGILGQLARAPGLAGTLATGFASRGSYLWLGGGYTRFAQSGGDQRPDTLSWSTVYGYRPARLRRGYDQWDYRGLIEFTGEHTGNVRLRNTVQAGTGTTTLWLGPSVLAIFKNIAIEGGVQGPIYRGVPQSIDGREAVRFAINFSYLKYSAHANAH